MAAVVDAFAGRLADRLVQVVDENVSLLKEVKTHVDGLVVDIRNFDAHLTQASRNPRSNENDVLRDVVGQIRNVVMEAEDAICKYTVEKKKHKDKGLLRYFEPPAYYSRIADSAKEIKAIRERVKEIRDSNAAALQALIADDGNAQPAIAAMPLIFFFFIELIAILGCSNRSSPSRHFRCPSPNSNSSPTHSQLSTSDNRRCANGAAPHTRLAAVIASLGDRPGSRRRRFRAIQCLYPVCERQGPIFVEQTQL